MIKVDQKHEYCKVTGDSVYVTFFYATWQSYLWSNFEEYIAGDKAPKDFLKQVRTALDGVRNGESVNLWTKGEPYQKALEFAAKCCENLGIKVERE